MRPEIIFPYATAIVLYITVPIILAVWRRIGVSALAALALGFLFVGIESTLDGYEAGLVLSQGGWNSIPASNLGYVLAVDTIRGIFIILWAGMEILFVFMLAGLSDKRVLYGVPALIIVAGIVETVYFNYRNYYPLDERIFISSAVRVLIFLVPTALFAGGYLLYSIYLNVGTKSSLLYGLGFLTHGLTLPFYSMMKENPITLGIWYALGGVIPALLAAMGTIMLEREVREEIVEEETEEVETESAS